MKNQISFLVKYFFVLLVCLLLFSSLVLAATRSSDGSAGQNQKLDCQSSDGCYEIDLVWSKLITLIGFSAIGYSNDKYWTSYDGGSGEWESFIEKYPQYNGDDDDDEGQSFGPCSYFGVGEPYGATTSSNTLNQIIKSPDSDSRVIRYADEWEEALDDKGIVGQSWVGKLDSNGPNDSDSLSNTGRLTIIFVPYTTDLSKDYELMYFFHGNGGFCGGEDWCYFQSFYSPTPFNDFSGRLTPQLREMSDDKRNFVLVFPELPWSSGDTSINADTGGKLRSGGSSIDIVKFQDDVIDIIKSEFEGTEGPSFVSMVGHSRGGEQLAAVSGYMSQLGVDKITFSDADYSSQTQAVYNTYVKDHSGVELNMLVSITGPHAPLKYSILLVNSIWDDANWEYEDEDNGFYEGIKVISTSPAEDDKIFKIPDHNNNINFVPLSKSHSQIAQMSLKFVESEWDVICESGVSDASYINGLVTIPQSSDYLLYSGSASYLLPEALSDFQSAASEYSNEYGREIVVVSAARTMRGQAELFYENCLMNGGVCSPLTCNIDGSDKSVLDYTTTSGGSRKYYLTGELDGYDINSGNKEEIIEKILEHGNLENCPHTKGYALDIYGNYPKSASSQEDMAKVMFDHGFCVLDSEDWHFEHIDSRGGESGSCSTNW